MRVSNFQINNFINGDMSGSLTSMAIALYQIYGWSAQFVFTGSPVGTLKVQVSCDPFSSTLPDSIQQPSNWTDLTGSSQSISAAAILLYNVKSRFYNWIRFVYTRSSGTGTINGRLNEKGM